MPLKGSIDADHFPRNEYIMQVVGLPSLTMTKIGEFEQELEVATLSDRRVVTGGSTKAIEVDVETPAHHTVEQATWESWYLQSQFPASPGYKKVATLTLVSSTGQKLSSWILEGVFPRKRKLTDLDMENEGEDARVTWTLSIDDWTPAG